MYSSHTNRVQFSLGSSLIIFSTFFIFPFLVNVNINRNQLRTTDTFDVVYFYSLNFWNISIRYIAKILTTRPRLSTVVKQVRNIKEMHALVQ